MDRQVAAKIIKDTFEHRFDKGLFINFSKNLVNYLDTSKNFIYQGNLIPDAYEHSIQSLERLGKYIDTDGNKIDVLIVRLVKEYSLERARTMQRNFVAWYLNGSRGGELKDAALAAFVSPDDRDWRFSLVKMEYNLIESSTGKIKIEKELTPARRYSFLVGETESSHTAQSQLLPILQDVQHNPLLSDLEKTFSIEKVTKEFFEKYRELFHKINEALENIVEKDEKIRKDFTDKGVNTVDFSKKLLGQIVFLYFLQKKGWFGVKRDDDWGSGPKYFLRSLFEKKRVTYHNFFNDILEPLFYEALAIERAEDFYSPFNCKIPFLNGGLFDPINDYSWVRTDILLPNQLFSNNQKTQEGDIGTGILDVFDRYNFTVKEDEPLDKDVAVDPEMLGKVFENLLEVNDRKSKGTYYTPREIVHYMCQESLINYLDISINTGESSLVRMRPPQGKLIGEQDPEQGTLKTTAHRDLVPLEDIASFVRMGELAIEHDTRVETYGKETERYSYKLPESVRLNANLIDEKLANIRVCDPAIGSGAFPVSLMMEIVRARNTLTTYLPDKEGRTNYNFKRHAIQNCLYGVDIDPGAVEIAKLRLWLSLVVDEEDIKQIKPLPNLDYKLVCGNSLLGVERRLETWQSFNELERLKPLYFNETNVKKKQQYRAQIDTQIRQLTNNNENFDFKVYFSEIFHENGGFDVVAGNPPYGLINKRQNITTGHIVSPTELNYYKKCKEYAPARGGMLNVFRLFIIRSLNILKNGGFYSQIFPLAFTGDISASRLRKHVLSNFNMLGIEAFPERDNEKTRVFEGVKMSVCILNVLKKHSDDKFFIRIHKDKFVDLRNEQVFMGTKDLEVIDNIDYTIPLLYQKDFDLVRKIYATSKRISHIGHCYTGEVDLTLDQKYLTDNPNEATFIKGAIIDRYTIKNKMSQGEIKYINSGLYLKENHGARSSHHNVQRIVMQAITGINERIRLKMTLVDRDVFCANSVNYIIINQTNIDLRYVLALLNSSLLNYIFKKTSTNSNVNGYEVDKLPVMLLDTSKQKPLISIVNQILALKRSDPDANINVLESELDSKVYDIYNLTPEEIEIVKKVH